ncbi:hypothetical protein C343_06699 [Cryptococcus neoformans C23]|uniref:Zn(2)-C6 fungal-type domain-containing protein n=1 Tax=Cryptococcus neoformans (strain H99 / ATCC 208821 / CBS 10515 / FGSC 9487) TaxID=235443 RepID=J9W151_CRYN9|nr:hypothetical protein CNAG_06483 [Cryptococcus neoformans var. grubii H99]AUB28899.1 hypothetical protein CKF44_06483 [Cryptococcus neoformans var. grubii]OWZ26471.1 hypothetical protein C347_06698 [Cryptococcus neoformans var. grubii AD2-60a]OWZ38523.1 hypothetical protein C343_06699 [Cryptococcus neoformans var. grubii C23]OXC81164.1 hypothetical protein C344_06605 [Cryptococcus neoformans var. grubii AD1-7a]AFR98714.2 hypothetical protein CNAG_06483 [Cryptococcus neoformans var. grubii H9|eukprot:XP_012053348.1 hypothetical protein CNAG_06483 [Cryptococcus neoformans var. grubii H99]
MSASTSSTGLTSPQQDTKDANAIRRTQRAPTSCIQCTKRKIRCSRTVPCSQCVGRAEGHRCRRELVLVKGKELRGGQDELKEDRPISVEQLLAENRELRRQLAEQKYRQSSDALASTGYDRSIARTFVSSHEVEGVSGDTVNDLEKMAAVMLLLEIGRSREGNADTFEFAKLQQPQPWSFPRLFTASSLPTLPSTFLSTRLVTFAVEALGFLHGTIHGPSFLQEHSKFIEEKDSQGILFMGTAWLGFYFSQLTLALHHLPALTTDAWGICNPKSLAQLWFNTSLQLLWSSDFMVSPDIMSLHTICALSCVFYAYGPPVFGSILTAAGVRLAQTLQINQIHDETLCKSAEKTDPCRVHGVAAIHIGGCPDMLDREIRRRLWWFLLYRDWLSLPAGFPYIVAAESLQSPDPLNLSDHHLVSHGPVVVPPVWVPTTASFHLARTRIARLTHQFFIAYRSLERHDPKRYEVVRSTDSSFARLFEDMPFFNPGGDGQNSSSPEVASWLPFARHLVLSLVAHKRLLLFRDHFAMAFSNSAYGEARDMCVARALEILDIRRAYPQPSYLIPEMSSHWAAAANVLALDLVYTPSSRQWSPENRALRIADVRELLSVLKINESCDSHTSKIVVQVETLFALDQCLRGGNYDENASSALFASQPVLLPPEEEQGIFPQFLTDDISFANIFNELRHDLRNGAETNGLW